ncbi:MAG: hypothetical protein AAGD03_24150, partial [Bordetella sp.]|nr:hypothetical protein [Pseudomonadota bacterium]
MNEKQPPTGATARPSLMSAPHLSGGTGPASTSTRVLAELGGTPAAAGRSPHRRTVGFLGAATAVAGLLAWAGWQHARPLPDAGPATPAPVAAPPVAVAAGAPPAPAQIVA